MKRILSFLPIIIALLCCTNCKHPKLPTPDPTPQKDTVKQIVTKTDTLTPDTETEAAMRALGLVDIQEIEPTIQVHLVYSTPDNFTHTILYKDIHKAFMLPVVADILKRAQAQLKAQHPDYSLLVYDAARPLSAQQPAAVCQRAVECVYPDQPYRHGGAGSIAFGERQCAGQGARGAKNHPKSARY